MPVRKQRPRPDAAPEWKRQAPLNPIRLCFLPRQFLGGLVTRSETRPEKRPRFRLEVAARDNRSTDPVREAVAEATRDERDPFVALVDIAERLDIDVVRLLTMTIATELVRREPTLKMPGRPALDSTDACYLLFKLEAFKRAAEAAASSEDPVEAALSSFRQSWRPEGSEDRAIAEALAARIHGRERAAASVALDVLRQFEPDLVAALVGRRSATEAKKRLRGLAKRDSDAPVRARWRELKSRAAALLNAEQ